MRTPTTDLAPAPHALLEPPNIVPRDLAPLPGAPPLTRSLTLHGGRAFAAAWLGLPPPDSPAPDAPTVPTLILVRDDGELSLPPPPASHAHPVATALGLLPANRQWSLPGLQAYCAGRRPAPALVFQQLVAVFDHFMDFAGSPGGQPFTSHFLASYVLATWLQPAFTTFSRLWLLGPTGSGKSRLLHLLARLIHLGLVVSPYGAHPHLFGLAALGAGLAVDDADNLFASRRLAAHHLHPANAAQAILLAGGRRGVFHPPPTAAPSLPASDLFGARLFTALFTPHPHLAASALLLSLAPSLNPFVLPRDPDTPSHWPLDPAALTDDLWALGLHAASSLAPHLAAAAEHPLVAADYSPGRPLTAPALTQAWRPLLAVAHWLADHGVSDALPLLRRLAPHVQRLPPPSPATQLAVIVLRALYTLASYRLLTHFLPPPPVLFASTDDRLAFERNFRPKRPAPPAGAASEDDDSRGYYSLNDFSTLAKYEFFLNNYWDEDGQRISFYDPQAREKLERAKARAKDAMDAACDAFPDMDPQMAILYAGGFRPPPGASPVPPYSEDDFRGFFEPLETVVPARLLTPDDHVALCTTTITFRPQALLDLIPDEAERLGLSHLVARLNLSALGHTLISFRLARRRDRGGALYDFTVAQLNDLLDHFQIPLDHLPTEEALQAARRALAALPDHDARRALLFGPTELVRQDRPAP